MVKLFISLMVLIVATNVTIAHCKHKNREVFHPSPNNEHIIDDVPSQTTKRPRKKGHKKHKENVNDEIIDIVPDIHLKKNHQRSDRDDDEPNIHISIEFDDNGKVSPSHKISKKDLPDWLDNKYDVNWNGNSKNEFDGIDYQNQNWNTNNHQTYWNHHDGWNNDPSGNNKWNHDHHEGDTIYKDNGALNIFVPELRWNKNGEKTGLVKLNDNLFDIILNTTQGSLENLHDIETDLLNVKLDFKPIFSLKTENVLDSDHKDRDSAKWNSNKWNSNKWNNNNWNNNKWNNDKGNNGRWNNGRWNNDKWNNDEYSIIDKHIDVHGIIKDGWVNRKSDGNRNHIRRETDSSNGNSKSVWEQSNDYQKWLEKQLRNKLDHENSNSHRGGIRGGDVVKVQNEESESEWSNAKNDNKRWNIEIHVPHDGKKKSKPKNHHNWKHSSTDDDDVAVAVAPADAVDGSADNEDGTNPVA